MFALNRIATFPRKRVRSKYSHDAYEREFKQIYIFAIRQVACYGKKYLRENNGLVSGRRRRVKCDMAKAIL